MKTRNYLFFKKKNEKAPNRTIALGNIKSFHFTPSEVANGSDARLTFE